MNRVYTITNPISCQVFEFGFDAFDLSSGGSLLGVEASSLTMAGSSLGDVSS